MRSPYDAFLELLLDEPEIAAWLDPDDRDDDTDAPEQQTAAAQRRRSQVAST